MKKILAFWLFQMLFGWALPQDSLSLNMDAIQIKYIKNNAHNIIKPSDSLPFYFDTVDHIDYTYLYDSIVLPQMDRKWGAKWKDEDTWTKARRLRIWTREYLDNAKWSTGNIWSGIYKTEIYNIKQIVTHRNNGGDGLCSYYATFFMHVCLASGINNRRVGWWRPNGDQLNEVYIPEKRKWVAMSSLYNAWFSYGGDALSLAEINHYNHAGLLDKVRTERDFQSTFPDPEIRIKNWLAHYSWDIYYWNKNGRLIANSPSGYRFYEEAYWPYNHFKAKFIIKETNSVDDVNFDVALIEAHVTSNGNTLRFVILDYAMVNFKKFQFDILSSDGEKVLSGSFVGRFKELSLEELEKTGYTIELYAVNSRGGKSQTVEIGINLP